MTSHPDRQETYALDIRLLGTFDACVRGERLPPLRSRRERWLLALLALRHDRDTSRQWLASTLWPDNDEEQALFYLRKALSNLRKALGPEAERLASPNPRTLRLNMTDCYADVIAFDRAVAAVERSSDPTEGLRQAVACYRGPLLPDCDEDWMALERGHRESAYLQALEQLSAISEPVQSVRWLRLLIEADPYRENAHRALMKALAECGDRAAVSAVYRELQSRLLQDLNASPAPETQALYRELQQREPQAVATPAQTTIAANPKRRLPVPLTDLVGRSKEIGELLELQKARRLITLLGAGGVGKTRLAVAVADAALEQFCDGACFIDLAPLSDSSLVPQAAAKALGIGENPLQSTTETLVEILRGSRMLLVLDNCEHVIEESAKLAEALLAGCPGLCILATSREPLRVDGEQLFRVPSLGIPSTSDLRSHDPLEGLDPTFSMRFEAVQLFVDRASRANSSFHMTRRNAHDVAEICRQLDGIPLAIELAAARIRSMSPAELCQRLSQSFRLLTGGSRTALPRQQTLRSLIDWSYDLLNESEKALLGRLSVFAGGWTLPMAAQICGEDGVGETEIVDTLASLADKSLVTVDGSGETARYRLLETVKHYAQDRLAERGEELTTIRIRHRDYFIELALDIRPKLMGADQARWFSILDAEHDNLRQALNLCMELPDGGQPGLKLAAALSRFWLTRGHFAEGRERYAAIAALPSAQERTRERAQALNGAGLLAWRQSDYPAAQALYAESISIARELGDIVDVGRALNNLALITRDLGDYASARAMHEESIEIIRASGDKLVTAICLSNLGAVDHYQGDFASARTAFEEGLAVQRELGDRSATSVTLNSLGEVARDQGDYRYAQQCHEEGLEIAKELSNSFDYASHLYGLGCCADHAGNIEEARALLLESLRTMYELGEKTLVTDYFSAMASLARKEHRESRAVRLLASRAELRKATGSPLPDYALQSMEAELAELRLQLGDDKFEAAWEAGKAMSLEQAYAYARGGSEQG